MTTLYDIQGTMYWATSYSDRFGPYIKVTNVWNDGNLIRYNWEAGMWYKYDWQFNFSWAYQYEESGGNSGTSSSGTDKIEDYRQDGVERYVYNTGEDYWTRYDTADRTIRLKCYVDPNVGSAATAETPWITIPKLDSYTVTYNANGGTGAPASQIKTYSTSLTISSTTPTRQNYTFKGWSVSPTSKIGIFQAGGTYPYNQNATLYAVWEYNGPTPTLNSPPNRFVNLEGLSIFWNKLKSKFGPTILYDRSARTTPTSTTTLSDRDVQLSESCFNYSKLVIETVFMNDFLITTTIYNPYPNYKFNIIQTQFVDNNHGGQDYATYVGFCRISADGTILRCTNNDGIWCSPTDWTVQWIPDLSSLGVTHAINKVIGYKM